MERKPETLRVDSYSGIHRDQTGALPTDSGADPARLYRSQNPETKGQLIRGHCTRLRPETHILALGVPVRSLVGPSMPDEPHVRPTAHGITGGRMSRPFGKNLVIWLAGLNQGICAGVSLRSIRK